MLLNFEAEAKSLTLSSSGPEDSGYGAEAKILPPRPVCPWGFNASGLQLLSYQCRSAELFSSFRCILKTELFDIAYSERKQSARCPLVCASDSLAMHGAIQVCFDW